MLRAVCEVVRVRMLQAMCEWGCVGVRVFVRVCGVCLCVCTELDGARIVQLSCVLCS